MKCVFVEFSINDFMNNVKTEGGFIGNLSVKYGFSTILKHLQIVVEVF